MAGQDGAGNQVVIIKSAQDVGAMNDTFEALASSAMSSESSMGLIKNLPARPIDKFIRKHAYLQIADDIVRRIDDGEFPYKLPSERAFSEEYETAYTTARRAIEELRERGVITTIHGR